MANTSRTRIADREGLVLVAIVVMLGLCMALFGLWAQAAVRSHHFLQGEQLRMEAGRLAESGIARALARRAADANYAGESWAIPAAESRGLRDGVVQIDVQSAAGLLRIKAVAAYPAEAVHHAQITKTVELPVNNTENET